MTQPATAASLPHLLPSISCPSPLEAKRIGASCYRELRGELRGDTCDAGLPTPPFHVRCSPPPSTYSLLADILPSSTLHLITYTLYPELWTMAFRRFGGGGMRRQSPHALAVELTGPEGPWVLVGVCMCACVCVGGGHVGMCTKMLT